MDNLGKLLCIVAVVAIVPVGRPKHWCCAQHVEGCPGAFESFVGAIGRAGRPIRTRQMEETRRF